MPENINMQSVEKLMLEYYSNFMIVIQNMCLVSTIGLNYFVLMLKNVAFCGFYTIFVCWVLLFFVVRSSENVTQYSPSGLLWCESTACRVSKSRTTEIQSQVFMLHRSGSMRLCVVKSRPPANSGQFFVIFFL